MKDRDWTYEDALAANPKELLARMQSILRDHRTAESVILLESEEMHGEVAKIVATIKEYGEFFLNQNSALDIVRSDIAAVEQAIDRLREGDPELAVTLIVDHEETMRMVSGVPAFDSDEEEEAVLNILDEVEDDE